MPLYDFTHKAPLSPEQQDSLAEAVTRIHAAHFTTPSLFVNVRFAPADRYRAYVGGRRKQANMLVARVRTSPARKRDVFDELCLQLAKTWQEIVPEDADLRIFIVGGITAGLLERGLLVPEAGKDGEWIRDNLPAFRKRAGEGNEEFRRLVEEIKERGLL